MIKTSRVKIETQITEGYIHPELHGQFIEHLGACIDGGIWVGEASDIANSNGLREEVVLALRELEPPVLRWPGGCFADTYHWKDGIGPKDKRPVTFNANFGTNELEYNAFGTHEFMDLCSKIKAKPWLNMNLLSGTVEEMVSWAEYCNRPHTTNLATLRKENGATEPFNVTYWGIGNEAWAGGGFYTAEGYADAYRRYVSAFPSFPVEEGINTLFPKCLPTKLIAVGPDGNKPIERVQWTTRFFKAMAEFRMPKMDAYDLHFYNWNSQNEAGTVTEFDEAGWYRLLDGALEIEEVLIEQYELINQYLPKGDKGPFSIEPKVDLIIGEWGNWHAFEQGKPALWQQNTVRDMVSYALTLDVFHKHCDKVTMACLAQSVNVLGSLILTEGETTILTPTYYLFLLYKPHRGALKVHCETESELKYSRISKVMGIHSFASIKDGIVTVNIINTDMNEKNEVMLSLDCGGEWLESQVLTGEHPWDMNDKEHLNKVVPKAGVLPNKRGDDWCLEVAKASVTVLRFKVR